MGAQVLWQPPVAGPRSFWIRNCDGKGVLGLNPCTQPAARNPDPRGGRVNLGEFGTGTGTGTMPSPD